MDLQVVGKPSFIKAIANDTNRHIINILLKKNMTVSDLLSLFYDKKINIQDEKGFYGIEIPIYERLYILEDVDCLTDIVLKRELQDELKNINKNNNFETQMKKQIIEQNNEPIITLNHLLNILDGVIEHFGRIIIMTTNHIEKIDSALMRPGRFDSVIEFKHCSSKTITTMINHIFLLNDNDIELLPESTIQKYDNIFTPAEVQEILLSNLFTPEKLEDQFEKKYIRLTQKYVKNEFSTYNKNSTDDNKILTYDNKILTYDNKILTYDNKNLIDELENDNKNLININKNLININKILTEHEDMQQIASMELNENIYDNNNNIINYKYIINNVKNGNIDSIQKYLDYNNLGNENRRINDDTIIRQIKTGYMDDLGLRRIIEYVVHNKPIKVEPLNNIYSNVIGINPKNKLQNKPYKKNNNAYDNLLFLNYLKI
jgi:hypothetical protein